MAAYSITGVCSHYCILKHDYDDYTLPTYRDRNARSIFILDYHRQLKYLKLLRDAYIKKLPLSPTTCNQIS